LAPITITIDSTVRGWPALIFRSPPLDGEISAVPLISPGPDWVCYGFPSSMESSFWI